MNYTRIVFAAIAAFFAYFVVGGLAFALLPWLKNEFLKYPAVYRPWEGQMKFMPLGMVAMFLAILALSMIYAMIFHGSSGFGAGLAAGARFGALIGIFSIGSFVVHNYVNLNIGLPLTMQQSLIYFIEWLLVGIVIGLVYRPAL
jgi:hypothetical protein